MFLYYVVKLANHNCCRFQWRIARETSVFILQDLNPMIAKSGKGCSSAQKKIRDVSELKQQMIDV